MKQELTRRGGPPWPQAAQGLEDASTVVRATTGLLRQTSSLLRQLVMIVGWLVLLAGSVRLLLTPPATLSPEHFLTPGPGAAAVAVAQGLLRMPARKQRPDAVSPRPPR
ncbi:hypothetical protein [Sphaerisporangium fuscum]|uniref:hypothetical protein n=1 Tax=Sphaerisporangium fuscum TaxID=2835868 RepID=UPI001BDCC0D8|nr:hypothetical protein [Sphaerisporangium fuscum]